MVARSGGKSLVWHDERVVIVLILLALGLTAILPQVGVVGAFVIAVVAAVVARKKGSFRDMGFRSPESWAKLVSTTLLYGIVIQMGFTIIVEPGLSRLTGEAVDISVFDIVRGDFFNFLLLMAVGWLVGGFLEEITFRGFVVGRLRWVLGSGVAATWIAVLAAAVPFGIAHFYQGITGMLATGMIGFLLGAVYVCHEYNLWYAILTHGFVNTVGFVAIYMDIDGEMGRWLF